MIYIIALISILLGSIAQYFLKIGMTSISIDNNKLISIIKESIINLHLIGGIACYGLSMVFWLYVLSKLELSKAYPLVSLGYVFTLILGYFLLHESINNYKVFGIIFIILGVILIAKS